MSQIDRLETPEQWPEANQTFAGYDLAQKIASGPMSHVFKAAEADSGQVVALKILSKRSARIADRLRNGGHRTWEGKRAVGLSHPNIVRTLRCGFEEGRYFLAMEYLDGPNLAELIQQQAPELQNGRFGIIRQIAQGLCYVHEKGLIHRDICPKNVMLTGEGEGKLIDFGVAISRGDRVTDTGRRTGRPSYMAPELVRHNVFDERTDIYAFGVTMYEILTGVRPLIGRNRYEKMQMHLNLQPVAPSQVAPGLPVQIDDIALKALAKAPEERYQTMAALLSDLSLIAA